MLVPNKDMSEPNYLHVFKSEQGINETLIRGGCNSCQFEEFQPLWWQRVGIAWMMGVEMAQEETSQFARRRGGSVADATGLGKT